MKQYCRYCSNMVCGDVNYCTAKECCFSDSYIKAPNNCKLFELNPIDALGENANGYQPRKPKEPKKIQCDGQISLFGKG